MLRAVADHLGRDADGDLLRRFSQDRQTDGRVNAVDVLREKPAAASLSRVSATFFRLPMQPM